MLERLPYLQSRRSWICGVLATGMVEFEIMSRQCGLKAKGEVFDSWILKALLRPASHFLQLLAR